MEYGNDNITDVVSSEQTTIVSKICKCPRNAVTMNIVYYCYCDGQDMVLNFFKKHGFDNNCIRCAAWQGHLDILKYCIMKKQIDLIEDPHFFYDMCNLAAQGNHLNILKWLGSIQLPCYWNAAPYSTALEFDHLETIKWLISNNAPIFLFFDWPKYVDIDTQCLNLLFEINEINKIDKIKINKTIVKQIKRMKILISGEF